MFDNIWKFLFRKTQSHRGKICLLLKELVGTKKVISERQIETVFPHLRVEFQNYNHRRPDIFVLNEVDRNCTLVEITVCFDLYLDQAYANIINRYQPLVECLLRNGYRANVIVICFGSLGSVHNKAWSGLRNFTNNKRLIKDTLKWCSVSNIIGANYIWRSRVREILS